jgi:transcriptional regulator with XRE-family HTH domain/tetratricopeptide (TPR) repeat protein
MIAIVIAVGVLALLVMGALPGDARSDHRLADLLGCRQLLSTGATKETAVPESIDPAVWENSDLREALARRDISDVYRRLVMAGVQQRTIAALTRQSQSGISEIMAGRQVQSYDVLVRIADGLGVPRGWLGLAYHGSGPSTLDETQEVDEDVERRKFLALAGSIVVGSPVLGEPQPLTVRDVITRTPDKIGLADVGQYAASVTRLDVLDRESGGMAARAALAATARAGEALLTADAPDQARRELRRATSEAHRLAGWASGDVGLSEHCQWHMHRALTYAEGDDAQVSSVLAASAAMQKTHGNADDALRLLHLAQIGAPLADPQTGAVLAGLSASTYVAVGQPERARADLALARTLFAQAQPASSTPFFAFYGPGAGLLASVEAKLGDLDAARTEVTRALDTRPDYDVRCTALDTIVLATILIEAGEFRDGVTATRRALELVTEVGSQRVRDRLEPLERALAARRDSTCAELARRVRTLRVSTLAGLD